MLETMMDFVALCPIFDGKTGSADHCEAQSDWCIFDRGFELKQIYWDGSRLLNHNFSIELKLPASTDEERLSNNKTLAELATWLLNQNEKGLLPELGDGKEALSISCGNGELGLLDRDGIYGNYQIQFQLKYVERRGNLAAE